MNSEAVTAAGAPIPEVLWVEPDPDRPGVGHAAVVCPICWRVHTHTVRTGEQHIARAALCNDTVVYDIDLTGETW